MADTFSRKILKVVVAQLSQAIGWHAIQSTPLELMTDILHRYMEELGKLMHRYAEQFGHTEPNLDDVGLAFRDLGINLHELEEYIQNVDCVPCSYEIPKFPIPRESHLNFLKPGSREVVTRPVHVHEHLPPMHPEMEEEDYAGKQTPLTLDTTTTVGSTSPVASPKASVFKRPGEPVSVDTPSTKRARLNLEEEGRPLREISSVMMTTSGFLSPAREGKLPESRTPLQPSDSRSNSPQPSSYPMVPPEVKGEKKYKKIPFKRAADGTKKLDKENKKKEQKSKDVGKVDKVNPADDSRVKKLVSMKELSKLKALKSGALKMMAHSSAPGPSTSAKPKVGTKVPLVKTLPSTSPKNVKATSQVKPVHSAVPQRGTFASEKGKESGVVEGKLLAEPDKQKLNIFKKISKVKEDKSEKADRMDSFDAPLRDSRESSPGLVIDESEVHSRREARMAQIDHCIDAVIQRSMEISQIPAREPSMAVKQSSEDTTSLKVDVGSIDSFGQQADADHSVYIFDDDLFPPGTPSTPRTPELPVSISKGEKNSEVKDQKEKKKKKDKSKSKKEVKGKVKDSTSPKKMKTDVVDVESSDCPKTPEGPRPSETPSGPVFPFFSHFQPAPGLIPPPIAHPLFQRFPLPMGKNLPHPAMPNLPMPPPLFMQPRSEDTQELKEKGPGVGALTAPIATEKADKGPLPSPPIQKEKSAEKKLKEHKKDKKDKDKTKKKKDRKEKLKSKEKEEKKKIKSEKKERDKEKVKEKKEKKEKKRDRERDERLDGVQNVPKITLKLGPASPRPPTPDTTVCKLVIRPVLKKSQAVEEEGERVSCLGGEPSLNRREPSPELARISALITRPPRQKASSKTSFLKQEQPVDSLPTTTQTCLLPCASVCAPAALAPSPGSPLSTASGYMPKVKKSVKPVSKPKARDIVKKETEPHKEPIAFYYDNEGKKVWFCPACGGQDDGSPMIGCDDCDAWYHWVCVGIQVPPDENEDWYCRVCIVKKQDLVVDKKKKSRKRKLMTSSSH